MVICRPKRWHARHFWRLHGCGVVESFRGEKTVEGAREDAQKMAVAWSAAVVLVNLTDETIEHINHSDGRVKVVAEITMDDARRWADGG